MSGGRVSTRVVHECLSSFVLLGFFLGMLTVSAGSFLTNPYILFAGVFVQFFSNVVFGLMRLRTRLLFLILHGGMFLFWLTRPFIGAIYGTEAWFGATWDATFFSFGVIYLTMLSLLGGTILYESLHDEGPSLHVPGWKKRAPSAIENVGAQLASEGAFVGGFRKAAGVLFLFCATMALVQACCMLLYMHNRSYEELYLVSGSAYTPQFVSFFSPMLPYALCAYLAVLPKRRPATIALFANIVLSVPKLMIGGRVDFVSACIFLAVYYVFRHIVDAKERWITRRVIVGICVAVPIGIVFLGSVTYLRAGTEANFDNVFMSIADALYKQGVSFKVLQYGFDVNDDIQQLGPKFFVIGNLISNVTQGFIGQDLLGLPSLPGSNSVQLALYGNSYAHTMSFFAHPNYLGGEGYGSSYVLEAYADGGMAFVCLLSFFLGFVFAWLSSNMGRSWFITFVGLLAASVVYRLPRAAASEWISFIWTTRFWVFLALLVVLACVIASSSHMTLPADRERSCRRNMLLLRNFEKPKGKGCMPALGISRLLSEGKGVHNV